MAHFLRAKQAGIDNDLSDLIQNDSFVIDDVSTQVRREGASSTCYGTVTTIWRRVTSLRVGIRPGSVIACRWHQVYTGRTRSDLCLRAEANQCRLPLADSEGLGQDVAILFRPSHVLG